MHVYNVVILDYLPNLRTYSLAYLTVIPTDSIYIRSSYELWFWCGRLWYGMVKQGYDIMENVFVYLGILSPLWSISVSPVLAKRSSFTVDGPIPQMILLQSKQIWTMCRNICIRVKFTFQLSELSLPCCTFLSWNFANKPSTFLLISIILRRLVTMQFFASGSA